MNETDLIQAINGIDDKYLSESEEPYKKFGMIRNPYGLIIIAVAILAFVVPVGAVAIRHFLHRDNVEHYISGTDVVSLKNPNVIKNLMSENDDYRLTLDSLFSDGHNAMIIITSEAISENGQTRFNQNEFGIYLPSFCVKYADGNGGPYHHLTNPDIDLPVIETSYAYEYLEEVKDRDDMRFASIVNCRGIDLRKDIKLEMFECDRRSGDEWTYFIRRDPILAQNPIVVARFTDDRADGINYLEGIEFIVNFAPNVTCNTLYDADGRQIFMSAFELYSDDPAVIPGLCDVTFIKDSGERVRYEISDRVHASRDKDWACFVFGEFINPDEYAGVEVNGVEFWK
ncbi:MAG: hypothetical protein II477_12550 [Lachnospiraceae bacterium]|nr:hypothetical protein [Lachnospiraceae bacterium]MBQ3906137.1 hypothetical protein [Lachnospiraceae bacterium]